MKLTGYKMDCYVKAGKLASCPKYEGGKIIAFEREKFAFDVGMNAVLDVESVARATGSTPEQYDEVL